MAAILNNFDIVENTIEASANSAGSALKENEAVLDSIQGRINLFNNALQTMWNNALDDSFIKSVVDFGTAIVEVVDDIGLLNSALIAISAYKGFGALFKTLSDGGLTIGVVVKNLWSWATGVELVNTANAKQIVQQQLLQKSWIGSLAIQELEEQQTKQLTLAKYELALAEMGLRNGVATVADVQAAQAAVEAASVSVDITKIGTTELLSAAMKKLGKNILATVKTFWPLAAAAVVVWGVSTAIDALTDTTEELEERLEESSNALSDTTSKLQEFEQQLADVNSQIKELNEQDSLSFIEQEELERLKAQGDELERQIDLHQTLQKQQQSTVNADAYAVAQNYEKTGVTSGETTEEAVGNTVKNGVTAGGIAVGLTGVAASMGAFGAGNFWNPVGWMTLIAAAVIAASAAVTYAISDTEEKVGESLDNMKARRDELKKEFDEAQTAYFTSGDEDDKEAYEEAEEALSSYDAAISQHLSKLNESYSKMDWETATTEQREAMQEFYDTQDKWAISSGGKDAKVNAINRIFGENAPKKLKDVKKALEEAAEAGKEISLRDAFGPNGQADLDAFLARLYDMGIYAYEVEDAFRQAAVAAEELSKVDVYNSAKNSEGIAAGIGSIQAVFDEVNEKGYATSKTLGELETTMNGLGDAWINYANTMSSATTSTEEMKEATEDLVEAYLKQKLPSGPLTNEQFAVYVRDLENMGVKNAEDVMANQVRAGMLTEMTFAIDFDEDQVKRRFEQLKTSDKLKDLGINADITFDKLTSEQKDKIINYSEEGTLFDALSPHLDFEEAREIAMEYGYQIENSELQTLIPLLEERNEKEREYANLLAQEKQAEAYENQIKALREMEDAYNKMLSYDADANWLTVMSEDTSTAESQWDTRQHELASKGIDKQKFIDDFNTLKNLYGTLYVELGLEAQTTDDLKNEIKEKIADLETKIELELDPQKKAQLEAELDQIKTKAESIMGKVELDLEIKGLGQVGAVFDQYTSQMQTLASFQAEIANGFTISAEKAREFAAVYPEILAGAQMAADGQITLNADVVNSFIEGKQAELGASIEEKITELEADKAVLEAKKASAEGQLKLAKALAEGEAGITKEQLEWQVNAENIATEAFIALNIEESDAFMLARAAMAQNEEEFNRIVAEVTANMDANMAEATRSAAKNIYDAMNSGSQNVIGFAHNCSKAIEEFGKIGKEGAQPSYPKLSDVGGVNGGGNSANIKQYTGSFNGAVFDYTSQDINLDQFISDMELKVDGYTDAIAQIDGQIALLKSLSNKPLQSFNPNKSSGGGGGGGNTDKADDKEEEEEVEEENMNPNRRSEFEKAQELYERKLADLEGQRTWLENEIETLEAREKGVSKQYYDALIAGETQKLEMQKAQRGVLQGLYETQEASVNANRGRLDALRDKTSLTDAEQRELELLEEEVSEYNSIADTIWEIEHGIQESTLRIIEMQKEIVALYQTAFDKIGETYDYEISINDDQIASLQNYAELLELQGGIATKGLYDAMIGETQDNIATKWEQFGHQNDIVELLKSEENSFAPGTAEWEAFEIAREKGIIAARAEMRQLKLSIQEDEIAVLQLKEEFKELAKQAWDDVRAAYNNRTQYYQNQVDYMDTYISGLQAVNMNVPDDAYEIQIKSMKLANKSKWEDYLSARQAVKNYEESDTFDPDSQEYIDLINETIGLHNDYLNTENEILEKQQTIFNNQIDRFNQVIDRINNATQRMQNISSLLEDDDVATEDGDWTDEGLTRIGLAYQQMEYFKQTADEIADKMEEVEEAYEDGEITEKHYYETMQALEEQQWSAINSYEDMKDSIVELNEARIDMIEEGIEKEIDAMQELIDLRKEELESERD